MKKNRLVKVLTSAALTAAMVMSMGMSALAATTNAVGDIPITKNLTVPANTYAPTATFTFSIAPAQLEDVTDLAGGGSVGGVAGQTIKVTQGVPGGLYIADKDKSVSFAPGNEIKPVYTESTIISIEPTLFTEPGVYQYELKEDRPEDGKAIDGIKYDLEPRKVYVYVTSDDEGNLKVENVIVVDKDGQKTGGGKDQKEKGAVFTNKYGTEEGYKSYNLIVTKKVSGNQGNRNASFTFPVTVDSTVGKKYAVAKTGETELLTLESNKSSDFSLKDGESITIYGLTATDVFKVREQSYMNEGYTTTFSAVDEDKKAIDFTDFTDENQNKGKTGSLTKSTTLTVTNTKDVTAPTGIILSFAPYILLVAIAGVFAVSFLRKKREEF